jgi:hypothetical protein
MTLLAVVGWFAVIVLSPPASAEPYGSLTPRSPRTRTRAPLARVRLRREVAVGSLRPYERGSDWRPLLTLFDSERDRP